MKKLLSIIILVQLILSIFVLQSCSSKKPALEYEGYSISESEYKYWFMALEERYTEYYSDIRDTEEFWNSEYEEGKTYGSYMDSLIKNQIYCYLVSQKLFDDYNLSLSDDILDEIDESINDSIEYFGSKSEFNSFLSKYDINVNGLRKIYKMEEKFVEVQDYLFGDDGIMLPSEEEKDEYFKENYAHIKFITIYRNKKYSYDEDGKHITDSDGYYVYEDLTEEEKNERARYTDEVYKYVSSTGDFDKYIEKDYPEIYETYPKGFYITADDYIIYTTDVIDAAFGIKEGEVTSVSNEDAFFIVQRLPLEDKVYNDKAFSAQFTYFDSYVNGYYSNIYFESLFENVKETGNAPSMSVVND